MADVLTFSNKTTIDTKAKVKLKEFYFHAFANALNVVSNPDEVLVIVNIKTV